MTHIGERPRSRKPIAIGAAVIALALIVLPATGANAAALELPLDSSIPVPEITYPTAADYVYFTKPGGVRSFQGSVAREGVPGVHRTYVEKTLPDGAVVDHCVASNVANSTNQWTCGEEPVGTTEGEYIMRAYHTINGAARSEGSPTTVRAWVDGTAPAVPLLDLPSGYVTSDPRFRPTGTKELPPCRANPRWR